MQTGQSLRSPMPNTCQSMLFKDKSKGLIHTKNQVMLKPKSS